MISRYTRSYFLSISTWWFSVVHHIIDPFPWIPELWIIYTRFQGKLCQLSQILQTPFNKSSFICCWRIVAWILKFAPAAWSCKWVAQHAGESFSFHLHWKQFWCVMSSCRTYSTCDWFVPLFVWAVDMFGFSLQCILRTVKVWTKSWRWRMTSLLLHGWFKPLWEGLHQMHEDRNEKGNDEEKRKAIVQQPQNEIQHTQTYHDFKELPSLWDFGQRSLEHLLPSTFTCTTRLLIIVLLLRSICCIFSFHHG